MADTKPKPFVFVLMPFVKEFDDVYKLGIKQACNNAGAYAERVDEQIFQESILQRIYNQIDKADIIVADMTGRNPNVFYETGYAHALGKHVILLTKKTDDIPFDLKHYPHIVYGGRIAELIPELEKRIKWAIENPEGTAARKEPPIEFYIEGTPLSSSPTIFIKGASFYAIFLKIDAHNPDDKEIRAASFQVALITSERFHRSYTAKDTRSNVIGLQSGTLIHMRDDEFYILPGAWESFSFHLYKKDKDLVPGDEEDFTLRMFSEYGGHDYPFKVRVQHE